MSRKIVATTYAISVNGLIDTGNPVALGLLFAEAHVTFNLSVYFLGSREPREALSRPFFGFFSSASLIRFNNVDANTMDFFLLRFETTSVMKYL